MKTKAFELCMAKRQHAGELFCASADPSVRSNMNEGFPDSLEKWEQALETYSQLPREKGVFRVVTVDGKAAGTLGVVFGEHERRKSALISYWLAPQHWRSGISTAAVKIMCEYVFKNYDIVRIEATPFAYNLGSCRVLEKAGFSLEGVMKNAVCKDGDLYDSCMYAMLKAL